MHSDLDIVESNAHCLFLCGPHDDLFLLRGLWSKENRLEMSVQIIEHM